MKTTTKLYIIITALIALLAVREIKHAQRMDSMISRYTATVEYMDR